MFGLPSTSSSASAGDSSGGELAEAARRRSAAEAFGSYEAHLAACTRKFNKSGFSDLGTLG